MYRFPATIELLGKIPLLPCLAADLAKMEMSASRSTSSSLEVTPNTLLHWITAQVKPRTHLTNAKLGSRSSDFDVDFE